MPDNLTDASYLSRERVRSTFMEDFKAFMEEAVPEDRREFDWNDPEHDPGGKYLVDCRVNGMPKPIFVQALPNDGKTRDATITLLQFEKWGLLFRPWPYSRIRSRSTAKYWPGSAMFRKSSFPAWMPIRIESDTISRNL